MDRPEPTVARVPWNPWLGVVYVLLVFVASQVLAGLLLSIYPALKHWSHSYAGNWLTSSIYAQFVFFLLAEGLAIGGVYAFTRFYKTNLRIIGLRAPRPSDFLWGLVMVFPYYLVLGASVAVISHFVRGLNISQQQDVGFQGAHGFVEMTMVFISLVVLPPLAEEIMVRGMLYSSLKKAVPPFLAVIGTSFLFAAAHLPEGQSGGPLYIAAIDTFILSLALIFLRERTGGLWSSITLHAIKNGTAFVALFALHFH